MDWFLAHGIWILVAVAIGALAFWALWHWLPRGIRAIVSRITPSGDDWSRAARIISRILFWIGTIIIVFGVVLVILAQVGVDVSSVTGALKTAGGAIGAWLGSHGVRILIIVGIAAIFHQIAKRVLTRVVKGHVKRRSKERPVEEVEQRADTLGRFVSQMAIAVIWTVAAFMILSETGVNITPLLAAAGVIGIAIGFGAQSLIRDFLSGFFIILEDQYALGDWVTIAGVSGTVEDIGFRKTTLRDLDGICHTVCNGEIRTASNWSKDWGRVNLNIRVAYGEDLDHAIEVINRVCEEMAEEDYWRPLLLSTPKVLRVDNLGDSGIEIKVFGETKVLMQWDVMSELRKRIKKAFDEEGIEIPWPHMKVYFGEAASNRRVAAGSQEGRKDAPFFHRRRVPRQRPRSHRRRGPGGAASR